MVEAFVGSWDLQRSESFDEYMKNLNVNLMQRTLAVTVKPKTIISVENDVITVTTKSSIKTTKIQFKLAEEFDETTADNRATKTTVVLKDGKLVQTQKWDGKETTLVRELKDGKMILTCTMGDAVCTREYARSKDD
ncbi:fatty acid-binding protein, liver-like [Hemiscyllium ocellatum]|uniref:fatty acid-binding protein, liver-like n=1 Tax=Hemiscyllium ocellatum TaxID=170820 RepID=UPI002966C8FE|nr:fatty acid-binding protein, liver-like [Hemiscyllium ocellatum]